ncbi:MAG: ribosome small subunit-dependent GTPase A [Clostridia bacterium]|nr:ribosome small subunit-dependent GTPase A [Clostridia bacterium]
MPNETQGTVTRGVGGLYEVLLPSGTRIVCRAKGVLKRDDHIVKVGDTVSLQIDESGRGETTLTAVFPRRNDLIRPPLANVSLLLITASVSSPVPSLSTLDKMTVICRKEHIEPWMVFTKSDLDRGACHALAEIYRLSGFTVFEVSSQEQKGTEELKNALLLYLKDGGIAAVTGASGVGKSTLLNRLLPGYDLETGAVSQKSERGKHTTRKAELYPFAKGFIADTPGFSLLDFLRFDFLDLNDLLPAFPDFLPYASSCFYPDCSHTKEENCGVLQAVREGRIPASRHETYQELFKTLKAKKEYVYRKKQKTNRI